jgi:spermidine synthase
MTPRELIATAEVPGGPAMSLWRHAGHFMIMLGRDELMSSRMSGSEEALAVMTLARLKNAAGAHVLIGGYGMGFTLRAALASLGPGGRVTLAELMPEVIDWARGPMAALTADCLDDPRLRLIGGDVAAAIAEGRGAFDAILLDVDNGPDGLTRAGNDGLYAPDGLARAKAALRLGGVLAVWSAARDDGFTRRLRTAGFDVDPVTVRARSNGKGPRHVIWFARKVGQ